MSDFEYVDVEAEFSGCDPNLTDLPHGAVIVDIADDRHSPQVREQLMQNLDPFAGNLD
jgi:hypothetical protein